MESILIDSKKYVLVVIVLHTQMINFNSVYYKLLYKIPVKEERNAFSVYNLDKITCKSDREFPYHTYGNYCIRKAYR